MRRECRACEGTGNGATSSLVCPDCGSDEVHVSRDGESARCGACGYRSDDIDGDWVMKTRCEDCSGAGFVDPRDTDDAYEESRA